MRMHDNRETREMRTDLSGILHEEEGSDEETNNEQQRREHRV